jgi:hypothetical protein
MIMLITCLRDLSVDEFLNLELNLKFPNSEKCGPLSSVVYFSELIEAELVPTPAREIVPHDMVYKCANLHKLVSWGSICSKGPNMAMQPRFQTAVFAEFCLTLSQVGKDITSGILGVSLCMSLRA